jgi:hypothetical protein
MKEFIQESTMLSKGIDFAPTNNRYAVPVQNNSASVFLLSNSFEYDIQLIKHVPMPKISYKNILIPAKMNITVGTKPFRYGMTTSDYNKKLLYVNNQNLMPKLQDIRYPYPSHINENLYIPMSDLINKFNSVLQTFSAEYIRDNIFGIFSKVMNVYNFSKTRVMIIDTARYRLFDNMSMSTYKSDLINALLTGYMLSTQDKLPRLNWTFIFRAPEADYKFDLSKFTSSDREKLRNLLATIGLRKTIVQPEKPKIEDADKIDTDKAVDNIDKPDEETETDGEET